MAALGHRLIKLGALYCLLNSPTTAIPAHLLFQQDLPSVHQSCHELSTLVMDRISNESVKSQAEFFSFAIPIVIDFPKLSIFKNNESQCRFLADLTSAAGSEELRYGSCSVKYLQDYLTCSFTLRDNGSNLYFNFIVESEARTMCMQDTYPSVKAWDPAKGTECILNFGSSCCVYDPKFTASEILIVRDNKLPIMVSYFSAAVLVVAAAVYLLLKSMEWGFKKKRTGNQTTSLQGRI